MNCDKFWKLIEHIRDSSEGDIEAGMEVLTAALEQEPLEETIDFRDCYSHFTDLAYNWDFRGAMALVISPVCETDLDDAAAGLISLGREVFLRVVESPDRLAELSDSKVDVLYSAGYAEVAELVYFKRTGMPMPLLPAEAREPGGEPVDSLDLPAMRRRWPRLCKRFRPDIC